MNATHSVLDQDLITRLIARERGEEPVITLYMKTFGGDRRTVLKNLLKDGEAAIAADTGWDAERKKIATRILESVRSTAEELLERAYAQRRGSFALFGDAEGTQTVNMPLEVRDRIVVDRSPYASPLSSLIDQYERYGVILCDQKRAKLFDVYLGEVSAWEELEGEHERARHAPAGGPAKRGGGGKGAFHGLEELRRKNHAEYVLHLHLQSVADRAFRRFKLRPFDRLILCGAKEALPKLEDHLHSYLKQRVVAREHLAVDLSPDEAREKILEVEERVEREKESVLLAEIRDRQGRQGLGSAGLDETLRSLFYGKVKTLVVMDEAIMGRECPECHYLFEWPEDEKESTPTLVECPVCTRPTRRVPDLVDEAVELAILSGARVEHVSYAVEELKDMGSMAALLRFK